MHSQRCAALGAVWDDTGTGEDIGGRCLNSWQASRRIKDGRGSYEEVVVHISTDEHITGELQACSMAASVTAIHAKA